MPHIWDLYARRRIPVLKICSSKNKNKNMFFKQCSCKTGISRAWGNFKHQTCICYTSHVGFPGGSYRKEPACNVGGPGSKIPWVGKIPWRRAWQPTPVFLSGEPHGQSSLAGHSPSGLKESDTTERLSRYSFRMFTFWKHEVDFAECGRGLVFFWHSTPFLL